MRVLRCFQMRVHRRRVHQTGNHRWFSLHNFNRSEIKLAQLKATTIPRLELCAALLLAKWLARLNDTLRSKLIVDVVAWSDSSIVLSWLSVPHEPFKVFVSNGIHQIQTLLPGCRWNHIRTEDNPTDCASRGLKPRDLLDHSLYWKGPSCLSLMINFRSVG